MVYIHKYLMKFYLDAVKFLSFHGNLLMAMKASFASLYRSHHNYYCTRLAMLRRIALHLCTMNTNAHKIRDNQYTQVFITFKTIINILKAIVLESLKLY